MEKTMTTLTAIYNHPRSSLTFQLPHYHDEHDVKSELEALDLQRNIETKIGLFLEHGPDTGGFAFGANTADAYDDYDYSRIHIALYHAFHDQADLDAAQTYAEATRGKAIIIGDIKLLRVATSLYNDIRKLRFPKLSTFRPR